MTDGRKILETGAVARGRVTSPPSKSISHRYFALALLSGQPATVRRPLVAEDTGLSLDVFRALGWRVDEGDDAVDLAPPGVPRTDGPGTDDPVALHCGNAGTLFRFLTAVLTAVPGRFVLDGTERLRERPVGPLIEALRPLGPTVESRNTPGHAPLAIEGATFDGGRTVLDAGESSQYLSALLLAACRGRHVTEIEVSALTSAPYVELTRRAIRRFVEGEDPVSVVSGDGGATTFRVRPAPLSPPDDLAVPGDDSAAAYPAAMAALTGGRVELVGLERDSPQGDRRVLDLLSEMGATVEWRQASEVTGDDVVVVTGAADGRLRALEVDCSDIPDQVPTLAALAPFARGRTRLTGAAHLRIKESDRLRAMAEGLGRLGASVEELEDGLVIEGTWCEGMPDEVPDTSGEVVVDTFDDHRIAMAFALMGLRRPGVVVAEPGVVAKSYPGFWEDFGSLTGHHLRQRLAERIRTGEGIDRGADILKESRDWQR